MVKIGMTRVGILALQGAVREHRNMLARFEEIEPVEVKTRFDLNGLDGMIIPGGESTAMGKLLVDFGLKDVLVAMANQGVPMWGTCAGLILMAKEIAGQNNSHLGLMDIRVRRNAYGSQLDSFETSMRIPKVSPDEIPLVFIRAPYIEQVGDGVEVLARLDGKVIVAEEDNLLVTSFHPELTSDLSFHRYFLRKVKGFKEARSG